MEEDDDDCEDQEDETEGDDEDNGVGGYGEAIAQEEGCTVEIDQDAEGDNQEQEMDEIDMNDMPDCELAFDEEHYTQAFGEVKASGRSDSVQNIVKQVTMVRGPIHKLERQMTIAGLSGIRVMSNTQPTVSQSSFIILISK